MNQAASLIQGPSIPPQGKALVVEGVSLWRGKRRILDQVSIQAPLGQITAVIGPNGAGKSTVLKAILGLLPIRSGSIRWLGEDVLAMPGPQRARTVAYVPQQSLLSAGMTVLNVVATGRFAHHAALGLAGPSGADRVAIEQALGMVDAHGLIHRRFDELSGGERQRVLIARAHATGAQVLLLDEPTAGLDIGHALAAMRLLRRLAAQGCCIVVVLHSLDDVRRVADQVVLIDGGRVCAQGATASILGHPLLLTTFGIRLGPAHPSAFHLADEPI